MPNKKSLSTTNNRVLVKLRISSALKAAESRTNLRPLYDTSRSIITTPFSAVAEPQWFLADLPDGAQTPWDLAHTQIAGQLGVTESDVIFAEPDIIHDIYMAEEESRQDFAMGDKCQDDPQDDKSGKAVGDGVAWHLGDRYTQLAKARAEVNFSDPRTRIAHLDTGYYRAHETVPAHIVQHLEKSFVEGDGNPNSAEDPDNRVLILDASGHGTGTLSILAGGMVAAFGTNYLGGAPDAEIIPLRIADKVVLLRTSALARALDYAVEQHSDVVTLSMGGLPSRAWREAIDKAYLAGLCVVAAAGNNVNGLPTRHIVYPARYGRVLAVCGVMANDKPYADLTSLRMEGNFGPDSKMKAAIAAYTPNIPWARFGCKKAIRLNGEGTSAATPQVAAAVALWFEKYKDELPRDWRRIEAVRHALFTTTKSRDDQKRLGRGVLQAFDALSVKPLLGLEQTKSDNDSFAFLRLITGIGVAEPPPREKMFNLELSQRWLINPDLQKIVPDPEATSQLDDTSLKKFMQAIIEDEGASHALRKHVAARYPVAAGGSPQHNNKSKTIVPKAPPVCEIQPVLQKPAYRRLRVYGVDPSLSARFATAGTNEVTLKIRWETLEKEGPTGQYLAVDDIDAANKRYEPVDLNDSRLLAQDGWAPSEGNPQFHQQMVYAVAMKTIEHFERALGRPILWRPKVNPKDGNGNGDATFVKHLIIRPHALRQANAFYSPMEGALLFGYFEASAEHPGEHVPGSRVYACLSHDIIVHETTHAILDGMHRHFSEPTNPDMLALHEAFADIVALMQHFTIPEILVSEIGRTRGDIEAESMLGSLAIQFGHAMGGRGALRDAIGRMEGGVWKRIKPDPSDLQKRLTPHSRGAILVAAVFDAFIAIYKSRIADLLRIYTAGTGVLPNGSIHPDLVRRLSDEAAKSANHVLGICIRALDYLPPVDVTFFEYLRALITADFDLIKDDRYNYRVAFVEAFRQHGIYPVNLNAPTTDTPRTLSVDTLRWQGLNQSMISGGSKQEINKHYGAIIGVLKKYADACFYLKDRKNLFDATQKYRSKLHTELEKSSISYRRLPWSSVLIALRISRFTNCDGQCVSVPMVGVFRRLSSC